jgi:hypothetical protein
MLLLAFHIVSVSLLMAGVGYVAYVAGYRKAGRRIARRLKELGIALPEEE